MRGLHEMLPHAEETSEEDAAAGETSEAEDPADEAIEEAPAEDGESE